MNFETSNMVTTDDYDVENSDMSDMFEPQYSSYTQGIETTREGDNYPLPTSENEISETITTPGLKFTSTIEDIINMRLKALSCYSDNDFSIHYKTSKDNLKKIVSQHNHRNFDFLFNSPNHANEICDNLDHATKIDLQYFLKSTPLKI